ncbi:alpha/beta hydrolase [Halobacteriales archaeon QS_1_69_70]|nr:MAG: alpha/beta hydrolase [Halobacteriales archaeon QS_1_69_70]
MPPRGRRRPTRALSPRVPRRRRVDGPDPRPARRRRLHRRRAEHARLCADRPGAGRRYSPTALGDDAVALADAVPAELDVDADDPVLVGHDWGAVAAYAADRTDPDAFDRMVAMAVPPGFEALLLEHPRQLLRSWYMWVFQLPDVPERALRWRDFALLEALWTLWSPGWEAPDERIESVTTTFRAGETAEHALEYYRDTVGAQLSSLAGDLLRLDPPSIEDVPPVRTPSLVIAGEDDGCIGPELFDHASDIIEEARVVRIQDAGHFMHREWPEVVGEEIVAYVNG